MHLSPEEYVKFAKIYGKIETHFHMKRLEQHLEISVITAGKPGATKDNIWHSDGTYRKVRPKASMLYSKKIPERGGDTIWVDMEAAYESISDPIKALLGNLHAYHDITKAYKDTIFTPNAKGEVAKLVEEFSPVLHPVVAIHPATGNKSLNISSANTTRIEGLTIDESDSILNFLYQHLLTPEFQLRWRWDKNTVVIWDNRSTIHYAVADCFPLNREMHRISIL